MIRHVMASRRLIILQGSVIGLLYIYWSLRKWNMGSVEHETKLTTLDTPVMLQAAAWPAREVARIDSAMGSTPPRNRKPQKVVILMTQCRSGSSFTGRIFSATKGSMYLYEPLLPFGMDCTRFEHFKLPFLGRLLSCNFTGLLDQYAVGFKGVKYTNTGKCVKHGLCFAGKELRLDYSRTCYRMLNIKPPDDMFHSSSLLCGYPLKEKILNQQCAESDIIFTKVTRVCSLEKLQSIYDILKGKGKEVYVIHLIRDPRATSYSRYTSFGKTELDADVICRRIMKTLDIFAAKSSDNILDLVKDGRYMRIRFEDLASDTVGWTEKLFQFMGSEIPPEVKSNLLENLQQDRAELEKMKEFDEAKAEKLLKMLDDPFSPVKDTKEVLQKWRKGISMEMVLQVQKNCKSVMEDLGYILFDDERKLRNTTIPFFL